MYKKTRTWSKLLASLVLWTEGSRGGARLRSSRPSQSKPWNHLCFLMSMIPSFW